MDPTATAPPIVVGIDGSKHAVEAAVWAIDEAISRDAPLRLVHVINGHCRDRDRGYAYAGQILHKAWLGVEAAGRPVLVDSDVLEGDPVAELIEVSRTADMVCVGSKGTNDSPRQRRGSTAAALALGAQSPVAIIQRHRHRPLVSCKWIIAAVDESPPPHVVLQAAFEEAELRQAPVLALAPWPAGAGEAARPIYPKRSTIPLVEQGGTVPTLSCALCRCRRTCQRCGRRA